MVSPSTVEPPLGGSRLQHKEKCPLNEDDPCKEAGLILLIINHLNKKDSFVDWDWNY